MVAAAASTPAAVLPVAAPAMLGPAKATIDFPVMAVKAKLIYLLVYQIWDNLRKFFDVFTMLYRS